MLSCFHFESVKSFIQCNQKVMPFSNVYEFTFHEQKIIIIILFTSEFFNDFNLKHIYVVNIHFFTVFRNTTSNGRSVCLPVSNYRIDCNCLHTVR